jgi:aminoglycoside 2'-N-acetyltransferase I
MWPGGPPLNEARIRRLGTDQLSAAEVGQIRRIMLDAFEHDEHGGFTEDDWQHAIGGIHFLLEVDGRIVTHASVVERELHVDGRHIRTGYVEAVATAPAHQRLGYGSAVMREVGSYVAENFELGALGTGSQAFYERLGWQIWRGPAYVRAVEGDQRTADEEGYILVLLLPSSPALDLTARISCEWRPGDVW